MHVGAKQTQRRFHYDLHARGREFSVGGDLVFAKNFVLGLIGSLLHLMAVMDYCVIY